MYTKEESQYFCEGFVESVMLCLVNAGYAVPDEPFFDMLWMYADKEGYKEHKYPYLNGRLLAEKFLADKLPRKYPTINTGVYGAFLVIREEYASNFLKSIAGTELENPKMTKKGGLVAFEWLDLKGNPFLGDTDAEMALRKIIDPYQDYDYIVFGDCDEYHIRHSSGYFVAHPAFKIGEDGSVTISLGTKNAFKRKAGVKNPPSFFSKNT